VDHRKLALIHVIKRDLDLSDDAYRAILKEAAGVTSAKDLDDAGFRKLMRYFVRSEHYIIRPGGLTRRQSLFIRHLALQLRWDADHFRNFLRKFYRKAEIEELTRVEASHLIESLKGVMRHHGAHAGAVSPAEPPGT
jgi:hypothetical protein